MAAGPVFPAPSFARTLKEWVPTATPEYVFGLEQPEKERPSSRHWKLTPASLSENTNLALVEVVGFPGPLLIDGLGGGVVSIVHVYELLL